MRPLTPSASGGSVDGPGLASLIPPGAKVLWVASTGGHFAQLRRIAEASECSPNSVWMTFESNQTTSALQNSRHVYVDYVAPRDLRNTTRAAAVARKLLSEESFDVCISTGAALAVAVLPVAAMKKVPVCTYVESISRTSGPSLSGRILRVVPGVATYTQHEEWANDGWTYVGSVLDSWAATVRKDAHPPRKVFVTLGTIKPYRFDRAVDAVCAMLTEKDEVTWQLGATTRGDLPGEVHDQLPADEFERLIRESDVVVTHSGVGSIMQILDLGKSPVIAVRKRSAQEHVDNHQQFIADKMTDKGLAFELDLEAPDRKILLAAAQMAIVKGSGRESA